MQVQSARDALPNRSIKVVLMLGGRIDSDLPGVDPHPFGARYTNNMQIEIEPFPLAL